MSTALLLMRRLCKTRPLLSSVPKRCIHGPDLTARCFLTRDISDSLALDALRMDTTSHSNNSSSSSSSSSTSAVDMTKAREQHHMLVEALKSCGLEHQNLSSDGFADSVFIEDTAVVIGDTVFITTPAAESRRGETAAVRAFFTNNLSATSSAPTAEGGSAVGDAVVVGTADSSAISNTGGYGGVRSIVECDNDSFIDGGDVLYTGHDLFVGLTSRTNAAGIFCIASAFNPSSLSVIAIGMDATEEEGVLHLKSACSICGPKHILVGGVVGLQIQQQIEKHRPGFYTFTHVPDTAASNCVFVNNTLLRRHDNEFPKSAETLRGIGASESTRHILMEAGELAKVDGALTCCSLLV